MLSWIAVGAVIVGPALSYLEIVRPLVGFVMFALGGLVSVGAAVSGLLAAIRGHGMSPRHAVATIAALILVLAVSRGVGKPRINDFTTNLADPPAFTHATTLPQNANRDMTYPATFAAIQRACCADLRPATVPLDPAAAVERAATVLRRMNGVSITHTNVAAGIVEAVATSALFRFQDDIIVRVRAVEPGRSTIDVRSKSRDGKGDMGANAARIRAVVAALEAPSH